MEGQPTAKIKVLLIPGHGRNAEGSLSQCAIGEHEVNLYQAQVLQSLLMPDFDVNIFDPIGNDLKADGSATNGYDVVLCLHCNAFDKARNYTTVCVSSKYSKPQSDHVKLASKIAVAMAKSININTYAGPLYGAGVMPSDLYVLNAAHKNGVKFPLLLEPFFLDYYASVEVIQNCANYSMEAVAGVLRKEFLDRKSNK